MSTDKQFIKTDDPISVECPLPLPQTDPIKIDLFREVPFGHAPEPATIQATLPVGKWEKVVLTITGSEEGRQYDRLMHLFVGNTQLFAGCTPEPMKNRIDWKIEKDITGYLPALTGRQEFTMILENYLNDIHTGIPLMSAYLSFYPKTEISSGQELWEEQVPDSIIPIVSTPHPFKLGKEQTMTVPLKLGHNLKELYLNLYVIHQNYDEFYWEKKPAFREVEIYLDGTPAGVVWPDPILYTGGVNPLLWRPITGLHSMDIPVFRLNLTPFAGLVGGEHTLEIRVGNNSNYWLISGSLFLYQTDGEETSGKLITNSLQFPSQSLTTTEPILVSEEDQFITEIADKQYTIEGEVQTNDGTMTTKVHSQMQFSNDATKYASAKTNLVHGAQSVQTNETVTQDDEQISSKRHETTYTFDCTSSYLGNYSDHELSIPANLAQTFTDDFEYQSKELESPYHRNLTLHSQGYAALQRGTARPDVAQAATSANISFQDSRNESYQDMIMTRGGVVQYRRQTKNGRPFEN